MLSGGVIGVEISGRFFSEVFMLAVVGGLIICVQMVLWFMASWLLTTRLFRYGVPTAALASSPGGISGVVPAANQAGADVAVVSFAQLIRLGTIVAVVPVFVALFFAQS